MNGEQRIRSERRRQIELGYTQEHGQRRQWVDGRHGDQLCRAAAGFISPVRPFVLVKDGDGSRYSFIQAIQADWFDRKVPTWNRTVAEHIRSLEKGGAFLLAALDLAGDDHSFLRKISESAEHDNDHLFSGGELSLAAVAYVDFHLFRVARENEDNVQFKGFWPGSFMVREKSNVFDMDNLPLPFTDAKATKVERYSVAILLVASEIDRLLRLDQDPKLSLPYW